jgi:hypothetical protein
VPLSRLLLLRKIKLYKFKPGFLFHLILNNA